ncbi:MAG TPA: MFS transporter [Acidimicrobiia bacterium]|nr:MFS transporter [Acidimicrobiia bacterium]
MTDAVRAPIRLGLRNNLAQFGLLVAINALVGGMLGQERTVLPLLARDEFGVTTFSAVLMFVVAFGAAKALTNLVAGVLSDRFGRKPVLVAGWLVGLPIPLILIFAPGWGWVIAANVLLGINQGLTWSTTVIMKIDLVGPRQRGLAMGLNEASGYVALAATAWVTGWLAARYGLRPIPFLVGASYAAIGLGLSIFVVRDTRQHAQLEASAQPTDASRTTNAVVMKTSFREPALSAACQAGLINNLNDAVAWVLFPLMWGAAGIGTAAIGTLAALYPAVWGLGQLVTGAWSDRVGRKPLIVGGMLIQAVALGWIAAADSTRAWAIGAIALGAGTALVYPTLLAVISDVAHPSWRATAVGTYRFWRDAGFAIGGIAVGLIADRGGLEPAIWATAAVTAISGLVVWVRMYETLPASSATSFR